MRELSEPTRDVAEEISMVLQDVGPLLPVPYTIDTKPGMGRVDAANFAVPVASVPNFTHTVAAGVQHNVVLASMISCVILAVRTCLPIVF